MTPPHEVCYTLSMDFDLPAPTLAFTPFNKQIVVKPVEDEVLSKGGVILSEETRRSSPEGIVLAVAADLNGIVKPGDRVSYHRWREVVIGAEHVRLVAFDDVLGRVDSAEKVADA